MPTGQGRIPVLVEAARPRQLRRARAGRIPVLVEAARPRQLRRARAGLFLVMEGPDKSGKSTHAALLVRALRGRGLDVVHTREPGGTSLAEAVRRILLDPRQRIVPLAELFLYEAARAQHTHETLLPALRAGKIVVSERYAMASLAYQGCARGLGLPVVRTLNKVASFGLVPDLTLVLDIPESEFGLRPRGRLDRIEREGAAFRKRVRDAYRRLSRVEPGTVLVNGRLPLEELRRLILKRVEALLSKTAPSSRRKAS